MKVFITIGNDEIVEAIREWMQSKGIPVMALDSTIIRCRTPSGMQVVDDVRVEVSFTCDAYSSQDVVPGTPEARPEVPGRVRTP